MTETCTSCLFFFTTTGSPQGLCKRYPPMVAALPGHAIGSAAFPIVVATEWCGEHFPREQQSETIKGFLEDPPHADN